MLAGHAAPTAEINDQTDLYRLRRLFAGWEKYREEKENYDQACRPQKSGVHHNILLGNGVQEETGKLSRSVPSLLQKMNT